MNRQSHFRLNRATPPTRRGGLSLIEVAIAMAIFVIGAIALLRIFPPGLTVIEDSGKRLIGSRMANSLLARYDGEPLSIPDAIYDARFDGAWKWNDYPGAMLASRNKGQSLPRSVDRFDDSALGHLRFISGEGHEIQGPFGDGLVRVLSSVVVDRARADVYREAAVENVTVTDKGELDFANATYKNTGRGDRAISSLSGVVSGNGVSFHEPIIELANTNQAENLVEGSTTNLVLSLGNLSGVANRTAFYNGYVDQQHPEVSFSISAPILKGALWGTGMPTDDFTATAPNGNTVQPNVAYRISFGPDGQASIAINVTDDVLPEADEYFYIHVFGAKGCSVRQQRFLCRIPGNDTLAPGTVNDPTATPALVAVRPPLDVRATLAGNAMRPVIYLASYNWNNGGVRNEPLNFPLTDGDADYPQSCDNSWPSSFGERPGYVDRAYWNGASGNPQILPGPITLRFRQFLGTQSVANGTSVTLTGLQVPDIYSPNNPSARTFPVEELQNVWIDYNAYDWRYMTESVTQFSTPFPGSNQNVPQNLGPLFGFTNAADLREVHLPVGELLGPVYTINVYKDGSNQAKFDARTLDYRTVSDTAQRAALKRLFKDGRLLTSIRDSGPNAKFRFNAYYRTADGWAQQVGVTASRYLPWRDPAQYGTRSTQRQQLSQPWREYVLGSDGRLYFHPSEAGKTVAVQSAIGGNYTPYAIDDDIIDRPASIPAAFAPSGKVVTTGNVGNTVYDVASPDVATSTTDPATQTRGRDGMQGRTAWTNGDVYQQQFAP